MCVCVLGMSVCRCECERKKDRDTERGSTIHFIKSHRNKTILLIDYRKGRVLQIYDNLIYVRHGERFNEVRELKSGASPQM